MPPSRDATITFFPVGNGDTSLITLSDATTILIDLNVRQACEDEEDPAYDIHAHLLRELRHDSEGRPHLDVFILTHPDQDHVRGLSTVFYLGDPGHYTAKDMKAGRIIIDELWFAPRIFAAHEELCEQAIAFRVEAERRMSMHRGRAEARSTAGNLLRIIGYTDSPNLKGLKDITTVPGTTINIFNGDAKVDFDFFVHGPCKKDTDDDTCDRNDTSVVLQARFTVRGQARAALAFFGGDAGCAIWEDIYDKSAIDDLEWDILLVPHHCSWTFFSELPSEEEEVSDTILDFLDRRRAGARVISSSKPIRDDDDNPPHYIAAQRYRSKVGEDGLMCTMEHPNEEKPEPLLFSMTVNGPVKEDYEAASEVRSSAARKAVIGVPKTYGRTRR